MSKKSERQATDGYRSAGMNGVYARKGDYHRTQTGNVFFSTQPFKTPPGHLNVTRDCQDCSQIDDPREFAEKCIIDPNVRHAQIRFAPCTHGTNAFADRNYGDHIDSYSNRDNSVYNPTNPKNVDMSLGSNSNPNHAKFYAKQSNSTVGPDSTKWEGAATNGPMSYASVVGDL